MDLADTYITFVRQNQDILRDRINDELHIEKVFDVSKSRLTLMLMLMLMLFCFVAFCQEAPPELPVKSPCDL